MPEIHVETTVPATPERVFGLLTTEDGIKSFWTDQATVPSDVGSVAEFGFGPEWAMRLKMRIDGAEPGVQVKWHCLGDFPEWLDTDVVWDLAAADEGGTTVRLHHLGWESAEQSLPSVNFTWAMVLAQLAKNLGSGESQPMMVSTDGGHGG
jgi:uncharacterized protein YndB with AHSA1/START domain